MFHALFNLSLPPLLPSFVSDRYFLVCYFKSFAGFLNYSLVSLEIIVYILIYHNPLWINTNLIPVQY